MRLATTLFTTMLIMLPTLSWAGPTKLGEVQLQDRREGDRVRLPVCTRPGNRPVTELGITVSRFPAQIDRLVVQFYNGDTQELSVRKKFTPGSASRWIDLNGDARCIKTIRVVGDTDSLGWRPGRQARVLFWGRAG